MMTTAAINCEAARIRFPSHCGAMMTELLEVVDGACDLFPSHCGAMMTKASDEFRCVSDAFPSHCGAMMTQNAVTALVNAARSFHPTVVR